MTPATKAALEEKYGAKDMYWNWEDFTVTFKIDAQIISLNQLNEIRQLCGATNLTVEAKMGEVVTGYDLPDTKTTYLLIRLSNLYLSAP